jgi:hypothetical protein
MYDTIKKTLLSAALCLATAFSALAQRAAPVHKFESFIAGFEVQPGDDPWIYAGQSVAVVLSTNNLTGLQTSTITNILLDTKGIYLVGGGGWTNLYGQAGTAWFVQGQPFGVNYGTNIASVGYYGTNVNGGPGAWLTPYIGPPVWQAGGGATNQWGYNVFYTLWSAGATNTLGNNTVPASAFADCDAFSDLNGNPSAATISAVVTSDATGGTNLVTLQFGATYDGLYWNTNQVTLTATVNGTNSVLASTNLTVAQTTGVKKWRLESVVCGTNGVADQVFLNSCGVSGYHP